MIISKSDFLKYVQCQKYLWLWKNKKSLATPPSAASLAVMEEGNEAEKVAYKLFPKGQNAMTGDFSRDAWETQKLINEGASVIFQPTISGKNLYCRSDIIRLSKKTGKWDIFEVKGSSRVKSEHLIDLAFQKYCFEENGHKVGNLYLVHINSKYVRDGELEPKKLFKAEKVTAKVNKVLELYKEQIAQAFKVAASKEEPKVQIIRQCSNPHECAFMDYCWKNMPDYPIYDLWLTPQEIQELVEQKITAIEDLPAGYFVGKKFEKYCLTVKNKEPFIDIEGIKKELKKIKFPIYFLDYETYGSALPMYDGYRPYQAVVFQYSLHVWESPEAEIKHYEFLAREPHDPAQDLAASFEKIVGKKGTFVSWYKKFETERNTELAEKSPKHEALLKSMNKRMYDLMDSFSKGYYVHPDFCNSNSIKNVLPVVAPHLSYKTLNIQEGNTASKSWKKLIDKTITQAERDKIAQDMLTYCKMDTWAMVEIYKFLKNLVEGQDKQIAPVSPKRKSVKKEKGEQTLF